MDRSRDQMRLNAAGHKAFSCFMQNRNMHPIMADKPVSGVLGIKSSATLRFGLPTPPGNPELGT